MPHRRSNPPIRHYHKFNSALDYVKRGNFYAQQEKHKLAIADYSQAIKMTPHYTDAYYNRGISYLEPGKYELSISDVNKVIEIDSNNADGYLYRGNVYAKQEKYKLAKTDLQKAKLLFIDRDNTKEVREIERTLKRIDIEMK